MHATVGTSIRWDSRCTTTRRWCASPSITYLDVELDVLREPLTFRRGPVPLRDTRVSLETTARHRVPRRLGTD